MTTSDAPAPRGSSTWRRRRSPSIPRGRTAPVVRARALAARLARSVGFVARDLAPFAGADARTLQRLAHESRIDPRAELALRRRLTLELRVQAQVRIA
jgi:hypothetical protein